jgi:nucleoside-diphosphate-sugar epimerase
MRVLVTGGSGYLGSAIVRALARHGHEPVVFARRASAAELPGRAVDGDIRNRAEVMRAAGGVDAVCHCAALVSVWRPRFSEFDEINVGGLETMLQVVGALGIPRLVYTSSFLALPRPGVLTARHADHYQRTKVLARQVALTAADSGAPIVSIVPGVIYGPGIATEANLVGRLIADHLAGRLPGIVGADRCWSYAFVDDVAEAHVRALEQPDVGGEYIVGGENAPQMRLFEILRESTGVPLPRGVPFAVAGAAALFEEARARLTGRTPALTRGVIEILRHDWSLDSTRSERELSYRITPLESGIRAMLEKGDRSSCPTIPDQRG